MSLPDPTPWPESFFQSQHDDWAPSTCWQIDQMHFIWLVQNKLYFDLGKLFNSIYQLEDWNTLSILLATWLFSFVFDIL